MDRHVYFVRPAPLESGDDASIVDSFFVENEEKCFGVAPSVLKQYNPGMVREQGGVPRKVPGGV
jgi:hypothetical protein